MTSRERELALCSFPHITCYLFRSSERNEEEMYNGRDVVSYNAQVENTLKITLPITMSALLVNNARKARVKEWMWCNMIERKRGMALAKRLVRQIRVVSNPSNRIQYYNICLLTCLNQLLYLSIVQSNNVNKN